MTSHVERLMLNLAGSYIDVRDSVLTWRQIGCGVATKAPLNHVHRMECCLHFVSLHHQDGFAIFLRKTQHSVSFKPISFQTAIAGSGFVSPFQNSASMPSSHCDMITQVRFWQISLASDSLTIAAGVRART